MASILELPHELYLMICSYLTPEELTKLAGVSKDHYLAAQQPLFFCIIISSYSALVKLVRTLMKAPIVSHISPKQRLHWHKLSDEQLRERDIKRLTLTLNGHKDGDRITGATFEQCIGAISRKCITVKIAITFNGVWRDFAKQLEHAEIPNVRSVDMFLGQRHADPAGCDYLDERLWELTFSGSTFPDLEHASLNTLVGSADEMPFSMLDGLDLIAEKFRPGATYGAATPTRDTGYYGLRNMKKIKLEYNTLLTATILRSLFGSTINPQRLTTLEIVNCPTLTQSKTLKHWQRYSREVCNS